MVNLRDRSCICRIWDLSGIPCSHACSAIRFDGGIPDNYVDETYKKTTFLEAYAQYINPVPGETEWPTDSRTNITTCV